VYTAEVVRLLDDYYGSTNAEEALALTHQLEHVDIYSNSWGPDDSGETLDKIPKLVEEAFELGVTEVETYFDNCSETLLYELMCIYTHFLANKLQCNII